MLKCKVHLLVSRHSHCADIAAVVITTLKKIVNAAWGLENFDIVKLSRYMRCLFQYALPQNDTIADQLLDQIHGIAQSAMEVCCKSNSWSGC